jgi:tRNA threonylcarbamoyladenosine biosynthesis protein TsaB
VKLVLAFETSTPRGTVAVGWGEDVRASVELPVQSRHASTLLPAVDAVLSGAGVSLWELGGVAVGAGPGSFTGVRVAGATARGLVRGSGLPLIPVSSLASGAASLPAGVNGSTWICIDARGDRLFAARYRVTGGAVVEEVPPRATTVPELLLVGAEGARFAGDGAWRHRARIEESGGLVVPPPSGLPAAEGILRLVAAGAGPHPDPSHWEPDYLKGAGVAPPTP